MTSDTVAGAELDQDAGEYCRRVEEHLTRVNEGQLVRVAGAGFETVRAWALDGIPLSVAYRGIDQKAERHRAGASRRPLRIEFCDADVRTIFDDWRRAVGVTASPAEPAADDSPARAERRRPSLTKQIDRAIERLVRSSGRLDLPDSFREALGAAIDELTVVRQDAAHARGPAREALAARLPELDRRLMVAARAVVASELLSLAAVAASDLAGYRDRLDAAGWQRAIEASVDQLLRDRLGLPTLDPGLI